MKRIFESNINSYISREKREGKKQGLSDHSDLRLDSTLGNNDTPPLAAALRSRAAQKSDITFKRRALRRIRFSLASVLSSRKFNRSSGDKMSTKDIPQLKKAKAAQAKLKKQASVESSYRSLRSKKDKNVKHVPQLFKVGTKVYVSQDKLGEGAFGAVYCVKEQDGGPDAPLLALKVETAQGVFSDFLDWINGDVYHHGIRKEVQVYSKLGNGRANGIPNYYGFKPSSLFDGKRYLLIAKLENTLKEEARNRKRMLVRAKSNLRSLRYVRNEEKLKESVSDARKEYNLWLMESAEQMIRRIKTLHDGGFVHRDIKPDNFMFDKEGHLHVMDFGLSRCYRDKNGAHLPKNNNVSPVGTFRYMSLSAHQGKQQSRRDDMQGIAFVLFYLFQGKLPWQGIKEVKAQKKKDFEAEKKMHKNLLTQKRRFIRALTNPNENSADSSRRSIRQYRRNVDTESDEVVFEALSEFLRICAEMKEFSVTPEYKKIIEVFTDAKNCIENPELRRKDSVADKESDKMFEFDSISVASDDTRFDPVFAKARNEFDFGDGTDSSKKIKIKKPERSSAAKRPSLASKRTSNSSNARRSENSSFTGLAKPVL